MSEPNQSEEIIFDRVIALEVARRSSYLDQACAGNVALRSRVESLLRAHDEAGNLLELAPGETIRATLPKQGTEEKPGTLIGRYKLLQKIGEGGCGVVYLAEQMEPVRRRVALKVIKLGMDTKEVVARFEAERQALAMMDHPNIASIFDAGATDTGRPYFVMELVRGEPITSYCDANNLSTTGRLALFIQVCDAVQHAHQKGIIHRDLKPTNILVTINNGIAVPKVIDFGIAKATQGRLSDHTLFTAFEQFIGTPTYMSPEQAEMTSLDVDTRSDIYSLGVLLYELLTGQAPFDPKTLMQAGLDEIRRVIREVEPPKPSARLSTLAAINRDTAAKLRSTGSAQLTSLLRGDLDWIVMRCLEKDRRRRYDTAHDLALDLQRHLGSEPVWARPPSTLYRLGKYARRHRTLFVALIAVFAALAGGLAVALAGMLRAIAAQHTAENAQAEAEAVTEFLTTTVGAADPSHSGREVPVREVLDKASHTLAIQFEQRPLLQARLHETIGETYQGLGVFAVAAQHLKAAVHLRTRELGAHHPETLRACGKLAWVLVMTPEIEQAIPLAADTIAAYERMPHPNKQDLANAYVALSLAEFVHAGMQERSLEHNEKAVALFTEALGPQHPLTISARVESAVRMWLTERFDEGMDSCQRLIKETASMANHPARGQLFHAAALIAEELGDYTASAEYARQCNEVRTRVLGEEHYQTYNARFFEAFALSYLEDPKEHVRDAEKILGLQEKLVGPGSPNLPMVMARTALLLGLVGRSENAVVMARESTKSLRVFFGDAPFSFRATADLAMLESQAGYYVQAEQQSRALLDTLGREPRRYEHSFSRAKIALATALIGQNKLTEADKILQENQNTLTGLRMNVSFQLALTRRALALLQQAREKQDSLNAY